MLLRLLFRKDDDDDADDDDEKGDETSAEQQPVVYSNNVTMSRNQSQFTIVPRQMIPLPTSNGTEIETVPVYLTSNLDT